MTPKEQFDKLVKCGLKVIKLNKKLTPIDMGYNKDGFVYETEYIEGQYYGIVGGSIHTDKDGKKGELLFIDFDIKKKVNGKVTIVPEALTKLDSIRPQLLERDYYNCKSKSGGLHTGILVSESVKQSVNLYSHQECKDLRIDTRTKVGMVVAIAKNYQINKIPETFDRVITDFESFMYAYGFAVNSSTSKNESGSLSIEYKVKARECLDKMSIKGFEELGTEKVSTHDVKNFWAYSCKGRDIPLVEAIEKIMFLLSQFDTSKNNSKTEREIVNIYNVNYDNFKKQSDKNSKRLDDLLTNGQGDLSDEYAIIELTKLLILEKRMVSILDLRHGLKQWCSKWKIKNKELGKIIDSVINLPEIFIQVKKICFDLGLERHKTIFDRSQITEVSQFLKGRYHIKRIELSGKLIIFNDKHYEQDAEALLRRVARDSILKSKNTDMVEILSQVEDTCTIITAKDIENYVHKKCFLNGIYDIKTGVFETEFNPDYIILNQIPFDYVTDGRYETIQQRISEIIPNNEDQQTYKDWGSTCLHPYSGIDFQLGLVGIAGSGKGRLARLFRICFGENNVTHATIQKLASDGTIQIECAYGFANIDEEMSDTDISHIETVKKWVTQDPFTGRGIYGHKTTYRPTARIMLCANNLYEIPSPDDSLAIYERTHLINCNQKFRGTEKEVKNLWAEIDESEFSEFISYIVRNATKVYERQGIQFPQDTEHTERLWNQYGNQIRNFISEWIERIPHEKTEGNDIWASFLSDQLSKGLDVKGKNQFYKKFDEILGQTSTKIRDGDLEFYGYLGVKLRSVDEKTEQSRIDATPKGKILKIINKFEDDDKRIAKIEGLLQ